MIEFGNYSFPNAFPTISFPTIFQKLKMVGVPEQFIKLLSNILYKARFHVVDGDRSTKPLQTKNGVLQGDCLSPLLFNIFISDLPESFSHNGPTLNGSDKQIQYLQYADDLAIVAESASGLQQALRQLGEYCQKNHLQVNTRKTKIMIFHLGGLSKSLKKLQFKYEAQTIERVNSFKYLGITLSTQLSYTDHIKDLIQRCKARIGVVFSKLRLAWLPLDIVLRIFQIYVLPLLEYALCIWISGKSAPTIRTKLNAVFTKFLKRYLGVPYHSSNDPVHHICQTYPLYQILTNLSHQRLNGIVLPLCLSGTQLTLIQNLPKEIEPTPSYRLLPSYFWRSRMIWKLPTNPFYRKSLCCEVLDTKHYLSCTVKKFHKGPEDECICNICNENNHPYHLLYFCN